MSVDPSRLYTELLNTGLQQKDPPLYQVIYNLIRNLVSISKQTPTVVTGGGGSSTTIINQTTQGTPGIDGLDGEDGFPIQGLTGKDGISNVPGPVGPMGAIIFPPDGEDGDIYPPIVGPQGNPGIQGIQGHIGPVLLVEDGLPGEDGFPGIQGPKGDPGSGTPGVVLSVTVNISDAEWRSLDTVPKTILAAQGSGTVIVPLSMTLVEDVVSGFNSANSINIRYIGGATTAFTSMSGTSNLTGKKYAHSSFFTSQQGSAAGIENTGIEAFGSIGLAGGSTVNGFNFTLLYVIITYP